MGRSPCCEKVGLKKGPWTPEEDQKLLAYIEEHGHGSWRALPSKAGLQRCGKSCRLRWTNYLRPDIKRGKFILQEEQTIIQLHALLGNRWSAIATHLPKRTDNEIKNYWNTHLKKRLAKMGIDPVTHKPKSDALSSPDGGPHSRAAANLSHMAQWESARLEAEARLVREAKLRSSSSSAITFQAPHLPVGLTSGAPAAGPPPPACLDVLRAWQGAWPTTSKGSSGSTISTTTKGSSSGGRVVDQESPTSTLSFSETTVGAGMGHFVDQVDHTSSPMTLPRRDVDPEEAVDWKFFGKPMRLQLEAAKVDDNHQSEINLGGSGGFPPMEPFGAIDGAWLHEPPFKLKQGGPSGSSFGEGFTEMLLENSVDDRQNSLDGDDSSCAAAAESGRRGLEEESKSYWSSILNLVNSGGSPSGSPPLF